MKGTLIGRPGCAIAIGYGLHSRHSSHQQPSVQLATVQRVWNPVATADGRHQNHGLLELRPERKRGRRLQGRREPVCYFGERSCRGGLDELLGHEESCFRRSSGNLQKLS